MFWPILKMNFVPNKNLRPVAEVLTTKLAASQEEGIRLLRF